MQARALLCRVFGRAGQLWEERDAAAVYGDEFQLLHKVGVSLPVALPEEMLSLEFVVVKGLLAYNNDGSDCGVRRSEGFTMSCGLPAAQYGTPTFNPCIPCTRLRAYM